MPYFLVVACLILAVPVSSLQGQRLQDRIDAVRARNEQQAQREEAGPQDTPGIPQKMSMIIGEVAFDHTEARDAFNWWASRTDIPMVINWNAMEIEGVDPTQPITMELRTVPARLLLDAIMRQASLDVELIYEATPWYVQVMTKRQANRHPVMRIYDVSDMVMRIPNFTDAPSFDLTEALSNTSSGGGGGGGSQGLFTDNEDNEDKDQPTKTEQGQGLAEMIRNSIEPGIWQTHGGQFASVRYYNGRLIVNAPIYVHRQIGIPIAPVRVNVPGIGGRYLQDQPGR